MRVFAKIAACLAVIVLGSVALAADLPKKGQPVESVVADLTKLTSLNIAGAGAECGVPGDLGQVIGVRKDVYGLPGSDPTKEESDLAELWYVYDASTNQAEPHPFVGVRYDPTSPAPIYVAFALGADGIIDSVVLAQDLERAPNPCAALVIHLTREGKI